MNLKKLTIITGLSLSVLAFSGSTQNTKLHAFCLSDGQCTTGTIKDLYDFSGMPGEAGYKGTNTTKAPAPRQTQRVATPAYTAPKQTVVTPKYTAPVQHVSTPVYSAPKQSVASSSYNTTSNDTSNNVSSSSADNSTQSVSTAVNNSSSSNSNSNNLDKQRLEKEKQLKLKQVHDEKLRSWNTEVTEFTKSIEDSKYLTKNDKKTLSNSVKSLSELSSLDNVRSQKSKLEGAFKLKVKNEKAKRQNTIIAWVSGVVVTTIVATSTIFYAIRKKRNQQK